VPIAAGAEIIFVGHGESRLPSSYDATESSVQFQPETCDMPATLAVVSLFLGYCGISWLARFLGFGMPSIKSQSDMDCEAELQCTPETQTPPACR
jgi:hypothetical protein